MISKSTSANARRYALLCLGLLFVVTAVVLPTQWYDHIPRSSENLPAPPIKGVTLVRLGFLLEGLLFLYFYFASTRGVRGEMRQEDCLRLPPPMTSGGSDIRYPVAWVAAATLLAAALRLYGVNSDLWIDEITTVLDYLNVSAFHVVVSYTSSNNHLLNTLLIKALVHAAGPNEWAIRLPAVLFGISSVPAIYYLARTALARRESVWAAFLLAVSYHHIFFSQNARGYTGLLLWSILGTAFFLRGLTSPQRRYWVLYVITMFLGVATILYAFFIVAGHFLAFLAACVIQRRQGKPLRALTLRAITAWAILAIVSFHLYASSLPQTYVYMQNVYDMQNVSRTLAGGYAPLSLDYVRELSRGLSVGLGGLLGLLVAMAIGGLGFATFLRRQAFFCLTLILPLITTASFVLLLNLIVVPRSFLWGLPVACIFTVAAAAGLWQLAEASGRFRGPRGRRLVAQGPPAIVGVLLLLSLASLPAYYRTPKQPNRASLNWVLSQKGPDDPVVAVFLAEWGVRFYGPRLGLRQNESFWAIRSEAALQDLENTHPGKTIWLLTTMPRTLHLKYPALEQHISDRYRQQKTFAATIGGGQISVWRSVR